MDETRGFTDETAAYWLRMLIYAAIAALVNTLFGVLAFVPAALTKWIGCGTMAMKILTLLKLSPANDRYRKAYILYGAMLACTIAAESLRLGTVLNSIASVLSLIAVYQEYYGHFELVTAKDPYLPGKWRGLFLWNIISAVVVGFASVTAVMIVALAGVDTTKITTLIVTVVMLPQYIVEILYIVYLKRSAACFMNETEGF